MITTQLKSLAARPVVCSMAVRRTVASLSSANIQPSNSNISKRHQWSGMSFAQAESDFSASDRHYLHTRMQSQPTEWSYTLSYASAESDFSASDQFASKRTHATAADTWSGSLSFAAPESDFVSAPATALGMIHVGEALPESRRVGMQTPNESASISAAISSDFVHAPETAFGFVHVRELESQHQGRANRSVMFDLSNPIMAAPESATGSMSILHMLDYDLKAALQNYQAAKESLPKTVSEAMQDKRPIVITKAKAPFQVHDVNAAWEGLCGFSRDEAKNRSVGELLQGSATDDKLALTLIQHLQQTGFAEGTLTNYKKDGQAFTNHLQLGTVVDDTAATEDSEIFFVGILQDISTQKTASAV